MQVPVHPLGAAATEEEAEGVHATLLAGYRCLGAGWLSCFGVADGLPRWMGHI